jgi:REP element-mobilizing transposase RayT
MPLVDKVNGYDIVYKWFDYLKAQGHFINAFVPIAIGMPNHVHAVISFIETEQNINSIIGNGKRFMAYDIVKRLKENNEIELLNLLANAVERKRKANSKKYEVWKLSFDWKHCSSDKFIQQKIDYIPARPVRRA